MGMKKKLFITLAILFLSASCFSSCAPKSRSKSVISNTAVLDPYPKADVLPPKPHRELTPAPSLKEEQTPTPAPTLSDFWTTEDVDVSALNPEKKYVAFTFDDSPRKTLEKLVNVFLDFNVQNPDCQASATIFYNGIAVDERSFPIMQTAFATGLEVANHTFSHFRLPDLTEEELIREIDSMDEILQKIDGKPRHLLRAPYGAIDDKVRKVAKAPILDWSVDTLDWTGISAQEIYDSVLDGLESGGIVLMHDGFENTVEAVKRLLPELKARGYQVTSVSQLSRAHERPLKVGSVYTRARRKT